MPDQSHRERLAFTLVELLMVMAIIGILAALLLAAIVEAKARALRIQCVNNVRQLGIGLQAFLVDNSVYPLYVNPGFRHGAYPNHSMAWMTALQYTELSVPGNSTNHISFGQWSTAGVWKCPSALKPGNWPEDRVYEYYGYNSFGMSKITDTNSLGLGGQRGYFDSKGTAPPVSVSEVVSPSSMIAIGDGFIGGNNIIKDGAWVIDRTYDVTNLLGSTQRAYARHQGRANVVFCDGHVESPTLKSLFADTSDTALSRWNRDHQPHRERLSP